MTVTSTPPGIPSAPRLAGWTGRLPDRLLRGFGSFKLAVVLEGLVVPTLVARAHQVLDADD